MFEGWQWSDTALVAYPVLLFLGYVGFFWLRDQIIPPIGENLLYSGILGLIATEAAYDVKSPAPGIVICIAIVVGIFYVIIRIVQRSEVQERILKLVQGIEAGQFAKDTLFSIGMHLVEADYIPKSRANKWSGVREKRRQSYADLLNALTPGIVSKDTDFFPVGYERHWTVRGTKWAVGFSTGIFAISVLWTLYCIHVQAVTGKTGQKEEGAVSMSVPLTSLAVESVDERENCAEEKVRQAEIGEKSAATKLPEECIEPVMVVPAALVHVSDLLCREVWGAQRLRSGVGWVGVRTQYSLERSAGTRGTRGSAWRL